MPVPLPSIVETFQERGSPSTPPAKTIPFVPATSTPAVPASQEMVIDLVTVTAPKPPGPDN